MNTCYIWEHEDKIKQWSGYNKTVYDALMPQIIFGWHCFKMRLRGEDISFCQDACSLFLAYERGFLSSFTCVTG